MTFALSTVITVLTGESKKAVSGLSKVINHLSKETEKSNKRISTGWSKLGSDLAKTAAVAGGLFAGMIASSPQLQASLSFFDPLTLL